MMTEVKRSDWSRFCKRFNTTNQYRRATVTMKNGAREVELDRDNAFMGMALSKKGRLIDGIQLYTAHTDPNQISEPTITVKEPVKIAVEKSQQSGDERLVIQGKDGTVARVGLNGKQNRQWQRSLVEKVAYSMYEQRGYTSGKDVEDWLKAEQMVRAVEQMLVV